MKMLPLQFGVCVLTLPSVTGHLSLRRLGNLRSGSGQVCEGCDVHIQAELHSDSPEHFGEHAMLVRVQPVQAERLQDHLGLVHLHHWAVCLLQCDQDKVLADCDNLDEVSGTLMMIFSEKC